MSATEKGHPKNLANYEQVVAIVEAIGPNYQPSNPRIQITGLKAKWEEAKNAGESYRQVTALYEDLTNGREILFKQLIPLSMRVVAFLKSTGVPKQTLADAQAFIRLMRGARAKAKPKKQNAPAENEEQNNTPSPANAEEPHKYISVSHTGYHNQVEHFAGLLELVKNQPLYNPTEQDISIAGLQAFLDELKNKNSQEAMLNSQKQVAMIHRNEVYYHEETGLVNVSNETKAYATAILGNQAPQVKALRKLSIVNLKR